MRNIQLKESLYESIMTKVAPIVKNALNESFEEESNDKRLRLLADYLGVEVGELSILEWDANVIAYEDMQFYVVDEDTARELAENDAKNTFDELGIESFSENAQQYVLDNFIDSEWFSDALRENMESYVNDIRNEPSSSEEYETRLEEEMDEANVKTEEDYIEYLIDTAGDPIEYYKFNFGNKFFNKVVTDNNLIDIDAMAEWVVDEDGVANSLARYDGKEIDLGDGYFAYRAD